VSAVRILRFMVEHPDPGFTANEVATEFDKTRQWADHRLKKMADADLVEAKKAVIDPSGTGFLRKENNYCATTANLSSLLGHPPNHRSPTALFLNTPVLVEIFKTIVGPLARVLELGRDLVGSHKRIFVVFDRADYLRIGNSSFSLGHILCHTIHLPIAKVLWSPRYTVEPRTQGSLGRFLCKRTPRRWHAGARVRRNDNAN
jgi:hypothetical protein